MNFAHGLSDVRGALRNRTTASTARLLAAKARSTSATDWTEPSTIVRFLCGWRPVAFRTRAVT